MQARTQDNDTQEEKQINLPANLFEIFIQECLQIQLETTSNNPLFSLITKTRYALTQSSPLNTNQKTLLERLVNNIDTPMKVAIIGQFSSGKSTFLNALLGKEILPSGITPVTAKICEITYGEEINLEIFYKNGTTTNKPISYLNDVDEIENAKIAYYKLLVPLPFLKEVSFLDTPGFNSQNESDTEVTNTVLEEVDGIIWLTLIDNVGKNSEKEILQNHLKRYAHKSLCVLNQKDRLKNQEEINTSIEYAKKAFEGFFEEIIAISAKEALTSLNLQEQNDKEAYKQSDKNFFQTGLLSHYTSQDFNKDDKITHLLKSSNIKAVLDFIYNVIKPQAFSAKEYRILRELRTLLLHERRKLHRINLSYKELQKLLQTYTQKVRFNALQSNMEKNFQRLFVMLETQFDSLAQKIFNSFEFKTIEISRETKNFLGIKSQITQNKEVSILPKDRLMSELCNDENTHARELRKLGFLLSEFGTTFQEFSHSQKKELHNDLDFWRENALQSMQPTIQIDTTLNDCISNKYFRTEVLENEIFHDYDKLQDSCVQNLQTELLILQKMLVSNFQNTIMLSLQKLNFEVENALTKHKSNPDTLPLYNPTLENVRDLINLGLHFQLYQEKLSLNFPLYKKALWNLTQQLSQISQEKQLKIEQWIQDNKDKCTILQVCENTIKDYTKH